MITKKTIMPIATAAIMGLTIAAGTMPAYAQTPIPTPAKVNFFDGLVKYIADTFHLDQNQVKSAVSEYKTQHQVQTQQIRDDHEKTRLDQLVKNGKITQDQENAILAELASLKIKYDPSKLQGMTQDQRKQQFRQEQAEIQTWAKDHNIDPKYLRPDFGMGMRRGMMRSKYSTQNQTTLPTQ